MATLLLGACAALPSSGADRWQEEVLLHDGQKIVVERSQIYGPTPVIATWPIVKEHTLRFALPGTARELTWTAQSAADTGGYSELHPLAVHVLNSIAYVIATPVGCLSYNKWGRPNPPYVAFRRDGAHWRRLPLTELPTAFKDINLVLGTEAQYAKELRRQHLVDAPTVRRLNEDARAPELKSIVREAMAPGRCPMAPSSPKAPNPPSAAAG